MARNKIVFEAGKGHEMLRQFSANLAFVNGTATACIGQCPAAITIRRILVGNATALDFVGNFDIIALAALSDLDTAAASGNKLMATMTAFADKKMNAQALTSVATGILAADTMIVAKIDHTSILGTGLANIIVEYDVLGTSYAAYDDGDSAGPSYPAGQIL